MLFRNKIRELRDEQELLQRQLAAALEIDTPMFSKIERGRHESSLKHCFNTVLTALKHCFNTMPDGCRREGF